MGGGILLRDYNRSGTFLIFVLCVVLVLTLFIDNGASESNNSVNIEQGYVINTDSQKIHTVDCFSAEQIRCDHRAEYYGDIQFLLDNGCTLCGNCLGEE